MVNTIRRFYYVVSVLYDFCHIDLVLLKLKTCGHICYSYNIRSELYETTNNCKNRWFIKKVW